ncbi:glutathione S-transferase [Stutzerimonas stutzeri]|uniref:Glutathione S-transferase n=1 Tax=Stutzerimonas stutzeri TaxID=316 RepID=W8QWV5_STUST|nr:glutathione S-transferase [Stutzerimonas stutzeri]AHL74794.1 glutathione S-transferase [Stutzerimonas stutzeri]MCQ4329327.1 glutathione S-transferase [Stutzerimonas stutzeri]
MKLHDLSLSGNCYKARLFLSLLGQSVELIPVNLLQGEHKQVPFITINSRGQVPVLEDGEDRVVDSQAILVYLARRYADETWYPLDALTQARIVGWLSFAANEMHHGPATARVGRLFRRPIDEALTATRALAAMRIVEQQLAEHAWLAETAAPTIADIAVYPYAALAGEGGIDLVAYPAIRAWCSRIRELPGYIGMPGLE